mgnify:CR=1 FL=1
MLKYFAIASTVNTLSFLRVAAFSLAHAALTMVTFILKNMVPGGGLDFFTLPVEHLMIIGLEGLIVTIQCLRLEYYEFFSKFFQGDGIAYQPLIVDSEIITKHLKGGIT